MNCIIWNIRGTGNHASLDRVKKLVCDHNISCFCIIEPLIDFSKLPKVDRQFRFNNYFYNSNGKVWLLWRHTLVF